MRLVVRRRGFEISGENVFCSFLGRYDKNIFWHFSEMKLNFFDNKHHPSMLTSGALTEPVVHQNTCT